MGNYPPRWWWEWDAGNSNYRGLVVIGLENGQGTRVKQGRTKSPKAWQAQMWDPAGIGRTAIEITGNRDLNSIGKSDSEPELKPSAWGEDHKGRGDKSSPQRTVVYFYALWFFLNLVSWSARRWHSCPSQGVPKVTPLLSHPTSPDRFLISPRPQPRHLLMSEKRWCVLDPWKSLVMFESHSSPCAFIFFW